MVTRAGPDLEHALAGLGLEDLPQPLAAEERVGALDEETLTVREWRGMRPQPDHRADQERQEKQDDKKNPGHGVDSAVMQIVPLFRCGL